ncbi:MAG: AAA family ATPase [Microcoleus sp. PH2017_29_MFU_D_A]|uniref:AAA family ATPase n=1 Tax=unclassified Microcoleus TaxID=2642155 RepID=UPI001E0AAFA3|nr:MULTISPECIES: AAA family ATPase [unclassified Microcoleus]MCC3602086.1 AAA family ATPase [Microcoleus sp. PH2017_29_MFU_D_A]MCC3633239.1 AAA family ATPase [Microcoleus sp. PH2017_37_MFU_D_B]
MNVNQVLQFVDRLVVERTGKHLDDVQRAVVEGTWERQTYDDIAQKCYVTKNHVGDVGAELWQLLSEILGEDIKKSNFCSSLERVYIESSDNSNIYHINGSNNNFCPTQISNQISPRNKLKESDINTQSTSHYRDLTVAPQIINFYARESELKTLSNWILNQNTRLTSVLGLSGIGKTILVKRFVDLNLQGFEVIIWRSLKFPKSLELFVNDLLNACKQEAKETIDEKLKQLLDVFRDKKCLIILDDVHNIFIPGQFAGQYKSEYQDYQNFFTMITETEHQSNVILISQEQCAEMECLDEELYPIKCLELSDLDDRKLLKGTGLKDEDSWLKLINLYEGNPVYLKSIALLIKKIFDGEISEFLADNSLIITKDMQYNFHHLFKRISPIEQQIVLELSQFDKPVSREYLRQSLDLSSMDLINGLQSLQQRYLVTKIKEDKILFKLSSVFQEYVKNCCLNLQP